MAFKKRTLAIFNVVSIIIICLVAAGFMELQKIERANYQKVLNQLNSANQLVSDLKSDEYKLIYLGDFELTHYCLELYPHICGEGKGITYTGTQAIVGKTIAVDPKIIPYGTKVYIEGYGWRIAEDKGAWINDNHIDILVDTHDQALDLGTKTGGVWILAKNP